MGACYCSLQGLGMAGVTASHKWGSCRGFPPHIRGPQLLQLNLLSTAVGAAKCGDAGLDMLFCMILLQRFQPRLKAFMAAQR